MSPGGFGGRVYVLVVEDDYLIALCVEDTLATLGYGDIRKAPDLATAHKLLEETAPNFAILDVNLGRETVFSFAAALLARGVPFLFSTGNSRDSFPSEWQSHPIVPKPLHQGALQAALRAVGVA